MESTNSSAAARAARDELAAARRARQLQHDRLLDMAERHASLTTVQGDSYAEVIIMPAGAVTPEPDGHVIEVCFDAAFRGIEFAEYAS